MTDDARGRRDRLAVLASIMRRRWVAAVVVGVVVAQVAAVRLESPLVWRCPLQAATGHACPGCGLSRSVEAGVRGEWSRMMELHAFAPLVALALLLLAVSLLLPGHLRRRYVAATARVEGTTGATAIALGALVIYWLVRSF